MDIVPDHSPIILTVTNINVYPRLHNKNTDLTTVYKHKIEKEIDLDVSLKTYDEFDTAKWHRTQAPSLNRATNHLKLKLKEKQEKNHSKNMSRNSNRFDNSIWRSIRNKKNQKNMYDQYEMKKCQTPNGPEATETRQLRLLNILRKHLLQKVVLQMTKEIYLMLPKTYHPSKLLGQRNKKRN